MRMGSRVTGSSRGSAEPKEPSAVSGRRLGARTVIAVPAPASNDPQTTATEVRSPAGVPTGRGPRAADDVAPPKAPTPWAATARRPRPAAKDETRERKRAAGPREPDSGR